MLKKGFKRLLIIVILCFSFFGVLLGVITTPSILYSNKTILLNQEVYHNKPLSPYFKSSLEESLSLIKTSELYDKDDAFKICLDDGAFLPQVMNTIQGPAFGWGFFNQIVVRGDANYKENTIAINGYKWNLSQLMAHELTHCMQVNHLGFWNSNPVANYATWKWEGYPEYVSRQQFHQINLKENIRVLKQSDASNPSSWSIEFKDGTMSPKTYYTYWVYLQFCMQIKGMTYQDVLADKTLNVVTLESEIDKWYNQPLK